MSSKNNIMFEKNENLTQEDKKRKNKILFFIIFFILFLILAVDTIQKMPSKYTGTEEYYTIEGMQIPTLYKFTGYGNAYMANEVNDLVEGDIKGSFISIYYNKEVPEEKVNTFIEEIQKEGFQKIFYNGSEMYVKNNEDKTKFAYIFINEIQVKYAVCISGKYEDVLKYEESLNEEENLNKEITSNLEDNLNSVK